MLENSKKHTVSDEKKKGTLKNSRFFVGKDTVDPVVKEIGELMRTLKQFIILDKQNESCR